MSWLGALARAVVRPPSRMCMSQSYLQSATSPVLSSTARLVGRKARMDAAKLESGGFPPTPEAMEALLDILGRDAQGIKARDKVCASQPFARRFFDPALTQDVREDMAALLNILGTDAAGRKARAQLCGAASFASRYFDRALTQGVREDFKALLDILGADAAGCKARVQLCSADSFACRYFDRALTQGVREDLKALLDVLGTDAAGHAARRQLCSSDPFACRYFESPAESNHMRTRLKHIIASFGGPKHAFSMLPAIVNCLAYDSYRDAMGQLFDDIGNDNARLLMRQGSLVVSVKHFFCDALRTNIVNAVNSAGDKQTIVVRRLAVIPAAAVEAGKAEPGSEPALLWTRRLHDSAVSRKAFLADMRMWYQDRATPPPVRRRGNKHTA
jgi:hypothetical protein